MKKYRMTLEFTGDQVRRIRAGLSWCSKHMLSIDPTDKNGPYIREGMMEFQRQFEKELRNG